MTNCPNCGAPYTLDSPVCEYCGTVNESFAGWKFPPIENVESWESTVKYGQTVSILNALKQTQQELTLNAAQQEQISRLRFLITCGA